MMPLQEALRVFLSSGPGKVGLVFLGVLVAVSVYVVAAFPLDYGRQTWYNPAAWAEHPKNVPPAWVPGDHFRHRVLKARRPTAVAQGQGVRQLSYVFSVRHGGGRPPSFVSLAVGNVAYHGAPPILVLSLRRPDGHELVLSRWVAPGPYPDERPPFRRHEGLPDRVLLGQDEGLLERTAELLRRAFSVPTRAADLRGQVEGALFGAPDGPGEFRPLPGRYVLGLTVFLSHAEDRIGEMRIVLGGTRYGLMGTDGQGRDLAQGLLFGFPVALGIGLITSILTTIFGASLGLMSGYAGGRVDTLIQRFADVISNVPLLPLLIFLVFVLGPRLWLVVVLLVAFGWPGLTILSRSMVLQMRSSLLVEATRSLGAGPWRIMFRHMAFQIGPFLLAQMVFFTPGAILAEAGLSFLGLGDPSLPTWGQILEQGFRTGAIYLGYWWWVLPPGLLIVATSMAFVLITLGLEPVVSPRLRAR